MPREVAANSNKIISLANMGIEVNSDNAKSLGKYLACCVAKNPAVLSRTKSISHMGWIGDDFVPYTDEVSLDSTDEYGTLIDSTTNPLQKRHSERMAESCETAHGGTCICDWQ